MRSDLPVAVSGLRRTEAQSSEERAQKTQPEKSHGEQHPDEHADNPSHDVEVAEHQPTQRKATPLFHAVAVSDLLARDVTSDDGHDGSEIGTRSNSGKKPR